jgi:hypothetical protein
MVIVSGSGPVGSRMEDDDRSARAVDLAGNVQDPVVRSPLPSGATGLARISVVAAREG